MAKLQLLLLMCIVCFEASNACTRGFMDSDLLVERTTKLTSSESAKNLDAQLCIVPDVSFNCNGRITSLFIGATIKKAALSNQTLYPEIQIWRINSIDSTSTRQETQKIILNPGDFSPTGVLQYKLDPPMSFQSGDVLGVYQPPETDSAVTVYYHDNNESDVSTSNMYCITFSSDPPTILTGTVRETLRALNGKQPLILPQTGNPNCARNFLSHNEFDLLVLNANINDIKVRASLRLIPEINFTCNGFITKWIVGAKHQPDKNSEQFPELQIWRSMDGANYRKVGFNLLTISNARRLNNVSNAYVYTPNPPLEFQKGDVLGVYQPVDSEMEIYYQIFNGPANFKLDYTEAANIVPSPMLYDYPLVTVEIVSSTPLTISAKSSTPIQTSSSLETLFASSLIVLQSKMPDAQQVVFPVFVYSVISVAATLIVVAAVITLIFIIHFLRSRKTSRRNVQMDQNLCYAVNSQSVNYDDSKNTEKCPNNDDRFDVQDNSCYTKRNLNDLQNNICYAKQSPINLQNNPFYSDSIEMQNNSCYVMPNQDTVPEMPPIYAEVEDLYI